ncbi:MAG: TIGR03905 family TSCPD domain-containing protein [Oscillospiraceae bacterium]
MDTVYYTKGVCSREMDIKLKDGVIEDVRIIGGCDGNLQGIMRLVKGKRAEEVIPILKGIRCGKKNTSCPDQLSKALVKAMEAEKREKEGIERGIAVRKPISF